MTLPGIFLHQVTPRFINSHYYHTGPASFATGLNIHFIRFFQEYDPDIFMGGDNAIFWGPMSWTIIFGLIFATFLTLIVVPVMYLFFARVNRRLVCKS